MFLHGEERIAPERRVLQYLAHTYHFHLPVTGRHHDCAAEKKELPPQRFGGSHDIVNGGNAETKTIDFALLYFNSVLSPKPLLGRNRKSICSGENFSLRNGLDILKSLRYRRQI